MRIRLKEYELSAPLPINKEEIPDIQKRLGNNATLDYSLDGVKLKAGPYVGYIPVKEDLELVVVPKIENFEDFFYVFERANTTPTIWMDRTIFAGMVGSERENPPLFLIRMLVQKLQILKRDGFYRKSIPQSEVRSVVKGKINITKTLRQCVFHGLSHQIHCTYFDPSINTLENRFIKYTIYRLLATAGLPRDIRKELRDYWRAFSNIPFNSTELYLTKIETILRQRRFPRSRAYYLDILSLCFLIIENSTVVVKVGEDVRLSAFVIKMEDVFEKYIRAVLSEALHPKLSVVDGNKNKRALFKNSRDPEVPPDIMIYDASKCLLVADTKYKEKANPVVDDWYQVISYAMALEVPSGMLIYSASEPRPPRSFQIGDKTMWVYYFSLEQPKQQEEHLIRFFLERINEDTSATIPTSLVSSG